MLECFSRAVDYGKFETGVIWVLYFKPTSPKRLIEIPTYLPHRLSSTPQPFSLTPWDQRLAMIFSRHCSASSYNSDRAEKVWVCHRDFDSVSSKTVTNGWFNFHRMNWEDSLVRWYETNQVISSPNDNWKLEKIYYKHSTNNQLKPCKELVNDKGNCRALPLLRNVTHPLKAFIPSKHCVA